jgi:hypothetical protein
LGGGGVSKTRLQGYSIITQGSACNMEACRVGGASSQAGRRGKLASLKPIGDSWSYLAE